MTGRPVQLAHISDPHFGTEVPAVRKALLADLHAEPPDLIVLSGDITQRARHAQFRLARDFLGELPSVPRLCLPGNHDLPLFDVFTRALRPYGRYRRYIAPQLETVFEDERFAVIGVDATHRLRHTDGVLGRAHIERVAAQLSALRQPFRVIVTHQPLAAPLGSEQHNVAHGAAEALGRWLPAGADLFLGGHIHLPYCVQVGKGAAPGSGVLLQAGTCLSHRVRAGIPNSYNRVSLQDGGTRTLHIARRDFDAGTGRFATVHVWEAADVRPRAGQASHWQLATAPSPAVSPRSV